MSIWYSEYYPSPEVKLSIKIKNIIFTKQSDFQKVEIFDTERLGKLLVLDGYVMLSELDEFVYHEMIAHPALFTHPSPEKVLVVGGGDGGTIREVVKHPEVKQAYLVEIDEMVTKACMEFMPEVASQIKNEKVIAKFEDAVEFVKNTDEKFDVILIDSTDPISIGEGLFTKEFYTNCYNILNDDGILVAQSESAFYTPFYLPNIYKKINSVFDHVQLFRATIPTYPSGDWYFTFASKKYEPLKHFDSDRYHKFVSENSLKYYNDEIHKAAFAMPNFVKALLEGEED
ncbi:MAG: spermidine synthase [Calditrichia bacterium]